MTHRILILEAPGGILNDLRDALTSTVAGRDSVDVASRAALFARLENGPPADLIVMAYPEGDGTAPAGELLRLIRSRDVEVPIVTVAERGDVRSAADAVAAGATDFLVRGDRLADRLTTVLGKVRQMLTVIDRNRSLREQNRRLQEVDRHRYRIIGDSPEIRELLDRITSLAAIPRPVLIIGERGTGKELVARAIHVSSGRRDRPFVALNCAAFPETLLESELFGHEKGAFTGADRLVPGKFEQADEGTLFLDEIAHMPLAFQQKILRVIEYGTFARIGGSREIHSAARVLAATNVDLERAMRDGGFLPDLWDRLAFEVVRVPPLRERRGDIMLLARHFLAEFRREVPAIGDKPFSPDAIAALERYRYPGNVRELKTIVERAAYRDRTGDISADDLTLPREEDAGDRSSFHERVEAYQRRLIADALKAADGNQAEAARRLGLAYHRFRYYAQKLGANS